MSCCTPSHTDTIKCSGSCGLCCNYSGNFYESLCKGLCKTTDGCLKCCQISLSDEQGDFPLISKDDINKVKELFSDNKRFYVHSPLWINLAKNFSYLTTKSLTRLVQEISVIDSLPAACVVHIGKVGKISNVVENVNYLINQGVLIPGTSEIPHKLLLEVAAGQGTEIGISWEELRKIYEGLDKTRVGLCFDTQHLFASGMCSFDDHESVVKLFDGIESIGLKKPGLVHLNDSKKQFKSCIDRHAPLKQGFIWNKNDESLKYLIDRCYEGGIDLISETTDPVSDLKIVSLYKC